MGRVVSKDATRQRIHDRIRKRVKGVPEVPRLNVFRSLQHIYAQIVDDSHGSTLVSASARDKEVRQTIKSGGGVAGAGKRLFDSIRKAINERAMKLPAKTVKIVKAKLGYDAGLIGAATLVLYESGRENAAKK